MKNTTLSEICFDIIRNQIELPKAQEPITTQTDKILP